MRNWIAGSALVSCAFFLAFALPSTAIANGRFVIPAHGPTAEFHLRAANGYSISVFADHGHVSLTATKGQAVSEHYLASGLSSKTQLKARFGTIGRISVRFMPSHAPRLVPQPEGNCHGRGEIVQTGRFVGKIDFAGEQGYTTLHASRAIGKVSRSFKAVCVEGWSQGKGGPDIRTTILAAGSPQHVTVFAFRTESKEDIPSLNESSFTASVTERSPGLTIVRFISTTDKLSAFTITGLEGKITSATITPSAPFTGTATYEMTSGSKGTLTGSLAGNFPGRGEVALAEPGVPARTSISASTGTGDFQGSFFR